MDYDPRDVVSIDMKACYPASFQGIGEAKPYFERFGHPTHHMSRVAINGALPRDVGTGFAEFKNGSLRLPVILSSLPGLEGILQMPVGPDAALGFPCGVWLAEDSQSQGKDCLFGRQTEVWLPDHRDEACSVIGKFTQGSVAEGKKADREAGHRPGGARFPGP